MITKTRGLGAVNITGHILYSGANPPPNSTYSTQGDWDYCITQYTETPDFFKKKKAGELLPINHYYQYEVDRRISGTWEYDRYGQYVAYYDAPHPTPSSWWDGLLLDEALKDLAFEHDERQIALQTAITRLVQPKWDVLTFAGELDKTIDMFKSAAKRFAKLLDELRRRRRPGMDMAGIWLEARYGWRTLLYDLMSIQEALEHLEEKRAIWTSRFTIPTFENEYSETKTLSTSIYTVPITATIKQVVECRGHAASAIKPRSFGFDPAVTLWEMTKLSFVFDWFVDVGGALTMFSGMFFHPDLTSGASFRSTVTVEAHVSSKAVPKNPSSYGMTSYVYDYQGQATLNWRVPMSPETIPQININMDLDKVRDILMLLQQSIRR
jgi:hypothetical protein